MKRGAGGAGAADRLLALQTVLGAAGTLVVVIVFVIFGAPASGGTMPAVYLPDLWRIFGPYHDGSRTKALRVLPSWAT